MFMMCISSRNMRKLCSISCYLTLIVLFNNLNLSTSALSTTVPSTLSTNYSSHEITCSNVKDFFMQRGIAEKDITRTPIKGKEFFV